MSVEASASHNATAAATEKGNVTALVAIVPGTMAANQADAITAVKARLKGRQSKFNICIIGELDAVKCNGHEFASPTGAAHA